MRILSTSIVLVCCLSLNTIAHPKPILKSSANDEGNMHAMRKAIAALNAIKPDFDNTALNLCGHRADAADAVAKALTQLTSASSCGKQETEGAEVHGKTTQKRVKDVLKRLNKAAHELKEKGKNFCGNQQNALDATNNAIRVLTLVRDCKE